MIAKLFKPDGFVGEIEVPKGTTAIVVQDNPKYNGVYCRGVGGDTKQYFYWRQAHWTKGPTNEC